MSNASARGGRPDRRDHWGEIPVDESLAPRPAFDHVADPQGLGVVTKHPAHPAIEGDDIAEHREEVGAKGISTLGEDGGQRARAPLQSASDIAHTKTHVTRLCDHAETIEQPGESRVVALVVDDETGIDRVFLIADLNIDRMSVPARPIVTLKDRDVVVLAEHVGAREPSDTGSNDGDAHVVPVLRGCVRR